jgi:hypothetical protein
MVLVAAGLLFAGNACHVFEDDTGTAEDMQTEGGEPSLYRPGNRFSGWGGNTEDHYLDKVQPILGKRCVTCHGCTTSPCQLKLTSYEGVMRGANAHNIFENTVFAASTGPTRLKDGVTIEDWRAKGFYSVVDGGKDSVMFKMLAHGSEDNREGFNVKNAFGLYKEKAELLKFECLDSRANLDARLAKQGTGMPFGLPSLPPDEYATLTEWLEQGAPGPSAEAKKILAAARDEGAVAAWEDFFNKTSPKARLSARFIFEHLFHGKLHIDDASRSRGDFFDLVRSKTKTGPVEEIVTDTPNADPGAPFFYRLKKHTQIITAKDNTVFHLTDQLKARWQELFLDSAWDPGTVPGYGSLNPFEYFEKIPGKIRYQFMLENSHHLIDAMVKGDVCNGSSATYAIRDRFFTLFLKPESDPSAIDPKLGQESFFHLDPTSGSIFRDVDFENLFEAELKKLRPDGLSEKDLWDGGKKDKNAWITVFRHGNNASAHQGPMGQFPETMWVLDFGNFERLYYDLVVLYRPWGAITHKLSSWRQMSHVRSHGEDLFLLFLPEEHRDRIRKEFTPGWGRFTEVTMAGSGYPSAVRDLDPARVTQDFVSRVRGYLGAEIAGTTPLDPDPMSTPPAANTSNLRSRKDVEAALYELTLDRGKISDDLPDVTWVTVNAGDESYDYTLLANRIFWSNSRVVGDALPGLSRRPELDSISVVRGHIGAFPQLFLRVPFEDVGRAVRAGRGSREDRVAVRTKYEIRRNTAAFWSFLDGVHTRQLAANPLEAGIVDTSRYLWPLSVQSDAAGAVE